MKLTAQIEKLRKNFKEEMGYKYLRIKTFGLNTIQYIYWLESKLIRERYINTMLQHIKERQRKEIEELKQSGTTTLELTDDDHRTFVGDPLRDMISDAMDNLAVAFVNPGSVDIADHVNDLHEKLKEYVGTD